MEISQNAHAGDDERDAPAAGDWIEVAATGEGSARRGVILETLGEGSHLHFRVRWDEEHESLFYPAEHQYIVHRASSRGAANT